MCGIVGVFGAKLMQTELNHVLNNMIQSIRYRGPDGSGVWLADAHGLALGHARLSIIDHSAAGAQPMHCHSGRYVLVFNGEIYNHDTLRAELASAHRAPLWRGHSDSETLLACCVAFGIEATLSRLVGMFAFAIWDKAEQRLILARDRMGEKPLYYGWVQGAFVFASELKALRVYPHFDNAIDRQVLTRFLTHSVIPAPDSIYENIYKLEPGCWVSLDNKLLLSQSCQPKTYWSLNEKFHGGQKSLITDETEVLQRLESSLREAVNLQMVADVPVGAFLSGGIDSSLITALMQTQSTQPVQTFTIGFEQAAYDESAHAFAVAKHLGTKHHVLEVGMADLQHVIAQLPLMYDEPFADSSQIPTYLLSRLTRNNVIVALSGDGGDELFGGYHRYILARRLWNYVNWMPRALRRGFAACLQSISPQGWDVLAMSLPKRVRLPMLGHKIHKFSDRLRYINTLTAFYQSLLSEWPDAYHVVKGGAKDVCPWSGLDPSIDLEQHMMCFDAMHYLPNDILTKVDRAGMYASLETRMPFLDHRVVELAWRLPLNMKLRDGQGKWALRQLLYQYVPRALIERPKMGFGIPIGQWLRSAPLREWAEHLLDERRIEQAGYLYASPIRLMWKQHLSGDYDWTVRLWTVLMFQAWLEVYS